VLINVYFELKLMKNIFESCKVEYVETCQWSFFSGCILLLCEKESRRTSYDTAMWRRDYECCKEYLFTGHEWPTFADSPHCHDVFFDTRTSVWDKYYSFRTFSESKATAGIFLFWRKIDEETIQHDDEVWGLLSEMRSVAKMVGYTCSCSHVLKSLHFCMFVCVLV